MTELPDNSSKDGSQPPPDRDGQPCPPNIWHKGAIIKMDKEFRDGLYTVYYQLDAEVRTGLGLMLRIPVFIKDPLVALEDPAVGIKEIEVRLEKNMGPGPTSSRIAVVDRNQRTNTIRDPVIWVEDKGWFRTPLSESDWLPMGPDASDVKNKGCYEEFTREAIKNPYFHQVNVWAVVQSILEIFEGPWVLGRPIPWGFDGSRLTIIPHARCEKNSYYDYDAKELLFCDYGDEEHPRYTCLSHDIIAHETGHAILDGIRPLYIGTISVETKAFHEYIADMTAILLSLFNKDIRGSVIKDPEGLKGAHVLADLAKELAKEISVGDYLRSAFNERTMLDVENELDPYAVSQVLTGAMWDILNMIADKHMKKNLEGGKVTLAQALWWAAERTRRVVIRPIDLCPPCEIKFIDYAKAIIRNDILTNPRDEQGYRPAMLDIFHKRKMCRCSYRPDEDMPDDCLFKDVMHQERKSFVYHDIEHVSRSRTAAYYFLNDNRKLLHIPLHQDLRVVDLYETNKYGSAAERLPREIVLEYVWRETVELRNDAEHDLDYGTLNGKRINLDCGGTLVFDGRGNILSWSHKPGTEHVTKEEEERIYEKIRQKKSLYSHEREMLDTLNGGRQRIKDMCKTITKNTRRGFIREVRPGEIIGEATTPIIAIEDREVVRLYMTPRMRSIDLNEREDGKRSSTCRE